MKLTLLTFTLAVLSLYSCGTLKNTETMDNSATANELTNIYWKLETLQGKHISTSENPEREIGFSLKENKITGNTGCNNFFGSYSLGGGNRIHFSALGSTKMACPDNLIKESEFFRVFDLVDNYTIIGNTLTLNGGKRAPLAVFKKAYKLSDEPITEKYWKLKTLDGKEVKMIDNQEKEMFLMLKSEDNQVTGFSGCNTFGGEFTLEKGNRIHFSKLLSTMRACPDLDVRESEFMKVLGMADNYTIDDDVLSLNIGRRAPLAVFEAVYFN